MSFKTSRRKTRSGRSSRSGHSPRPNRKPKSTSFPTITVTAFEGSEEDVELDAVNNTVLSESETDDSLVISDDDPVNSTSFQIHNRTVNYNSYTVNNYIFYGGKKGGKGAKGGAKASGAGSPPGSPPPGPKSGAPKAKAKPPPEPEPDSDEDDGDWDDWDEGGKNSTEKDSNNSMLIMGVSLCCCCIIVFGGGLTAFAVWWTQCREDPNSKNRKKRKLDKSWAGPFPPPLPDDDGATPWDIKKGIRSVWAKKPELYSGKLSPEEKRKRAREWGFKEPKDADLCHGKEEAEVEKFFEEIKIGTSTTKVRVLPKIAGKMYEFFKKNADKTKKLFGDFEEKDGGKLVFKDEKKMKKVAEIIRRVTVYFLHGRPSKDPAPVKTLTELIADRSTREFIDAAPSLPLQKAEELRANNMYEDKGSLRGDFIRSSLGFLWNDVQEMQDGLEIMHHKAVSGGNFVKYFDWNSASIPPEDKPAAEELHNYIIAKNWNDGPMERFSKVADNVVVTNSLSAEYMVMEDFDLFILGVWYQTTLPKSIDGISNHEPFADMNKCMFAYVNASIDMGEGEARDGVRESNEFCKKALPAELALKQVNKAPEGQPEDLQCYDELLGFFQGETHFFLVEKMLTMFYSINSKTRSNMVVRGPLNLFRAITNPKDFILDIKPGQKTAFPQFTSTTIAFPVALAFDVHYRGETDKHHLLWLQLEDGLELPGLVPGAMNRDRNNYVVEAEVLLAPGSMIEKTGEFVLEFKEEKGANVFFQEIAGGKGKLWEGEKKINIHKFKFSTET